MFDVLAQAGLELFGLSVPLLLVVLGAGLMVMEAFAPGAHFIVVVANLEKSELFGVESDGMLLAAGEEADLLTTHEDAVPGTRVR